MLGIFGLSTGIFDLRAWIFNLTPWIFKLTPWIFNLGPGIFTLSQGIFGLSEGIFTGRAGIFTQGGWILSLACRSSPRGAPRSASHLSLGAFTCQCQSGYTGTSCGLCDTGFVEWPASSGTCVDDPCDPDPCTGANQAAGSCSQTGETAQGCDCVLGYYPVGGVCKPGVVARGTFGEPYQALVPDDAVPEVYADYRFAVITGLALDLAGMLVVGATITIHGHPEYGSTLTDANGHYSIPVNGGGLVKVVYRAAGYIEVHRQAEIAWNDIAVMDSVVLTAVEAHATEVVFDGNPATVVVHRNLEVEHQATLVFTGDNAAYAVDEHGVETPLGSITVRASEFETPEAMPEVLPATSAFTYCVELSADEASQVRFDQPVISYVKNFLGFDVGEIVPVGFYDRQRGLWVPSRNGVVVKLLDSDSDGVVDALDATGDNVADDLDDDLDLADEVVGLSDPQVYVPGDTYWRVEIAHFTPYDSNWPWGPPIDGTLPEILPPIIDTEVEEDCKQSSGCFVESRSRIVHQDIPVLGTGMWLHHASNRVQGYQVQVDIPASGPTVSPSLEGIVVRATIAGRVFDFSMPAAPNQLASFAWDKTDYWGNQISGMRAVLQVDVGYQYPSVYQSSGTDFENSWNQFGLSGLARTTIRGVSGFTSWQRFKRVIPIPLKHRYAELGTGWTLDVLHDYDPVSSAVFLGNGEKIDDQGMMIIDAVTTSWIGASREDGIPATEAWVTPYGIAVGSDGSLYLPDFADGSPRIRKVDPDGVITTVAGNGLAGYSGDVGPAMNASFYTPMDVAIGPDGSLYVADSANQNIRKVDNAGIITTVAGNGSIGFSGDGRPAVDAQFWNPYSVAVGPEGPLYISDLGNNVIRKVSPDGIITTVAGTGIAGDSGDGGPAVGARLSSPEGITISQDGSLYICEGYKVRKVSPDGIITTVAGTGVYGYSGDGGPALGARLKHPYDVAIGPEGALYIADTNNLRIRKVAEGIITTVAGTGNIGNYNEGGSPLDAALHFPYAIAFGPDGSLYVADVQQHNRVRKIYYPKYRISINPNEFLVPHTSDKGYVFSASDSRHLRTVDLTTGIALLTFGYDQDGLVASVTDQFDNVTTIERGGSGAATAIVSPDGQVTTLDIDPSGELRIVTYPGGDRYQFGYGAGALLTSKIDPRGGVYGYDYDANGRVTQVLDPAGGSTTYDRSVALNGSSTATVTTAAGSVISYQDSRSSSSGYDSTIIDPTGALTGFNRSENGLVTTKSVPCGSELTVLQGVDPQYKTSYVKEQREATPAGLLRTTLWGQTYEDTNLDETPGLITATTTVNGRAATTVTNTLLATATLTSPAGRTVATQYDPATLLPASVTTAGLVDTTFDYDAHGRLTTTVTGSRQTTNTYNAQGLLEAVTDQDSRVTGYGYDQRGRVTGIHGPDGSAVVLGYDQNGNMTSLTAPSGVEHRFTYNGVNLSSSYVAPVSGSYAYTYDLDRRLVQTVRPSGAQLNNEYTDGQLTRVLTPEGITDLTYVCGGQVGSVSRNGQAIAYAYDGHLPIAESLSGTLTHTLLYSYDNNFWTTSVTYAGGVSNLGYDNDGLLTSAGSFTIARNAGNGLIEGVSDGALAQVHTNNGHGELDAMDYRVAGASKATWDATRDNTGRITSKSETVDGVTSDYAYTYDVAGRLLTVTKDSTLVESYSYDAAGARVLETNTYKGMVDRALSYSEEDQVLTAGSVGYQYDVDGFLQRKTDGASVTEFVYSSLGELSSVTLPDATLVEYVYDPLGRRIAKKVGGVVVEKYLWFGLVRLLAVYDGSDNLLLRFVYAEGRLPVALEKEGATYYLAYDQVGSLRGVADVTGAVVKQVVYDSFGMIVADTDPGFSLPLGFAGGLHDRDTGLVRFGARDYDPDTGRWLSKDPLLFASGTVDFYGYCLNDPINFVDPLGLEGLSTGEKLAVDIASIIGGAIGGAMGAAAGGVMAPVGAGLGAALFGSVASSLLGGSGTDAAKVALSGLVGGLVKNYSTAVQYGMAFAVGAASELGPGSASSVMKSGMKAVAGKALGKILGEPMQVLGKSLGDVLGKSLGKSMLAGAEALGSGASTPSACP